MRVWMNEWIKDEWMNEWWMKDETYVSVSWHWYINKNERMNEWMNKGWMNEWMNDEWKMKPMYLYLDTGI